jgi:hypothetical protein
MRAFAKSPSEKVRNFVFGATRRAALMVNAACCVVVIWQFGSSSAHAAPPALLGAYAVDIEAADVELLPASSNACVAGARFHRNFQIIGVTNSAAPAFVAQLAENDYSGDRLTLSQDRTRAYMAGYLGGTKIIALDGPASPSLVGTFGDVGSRALDVAVTTDRQYAFVADEAAGILVVNLANEAVPFLAGQFDAVFSNEHSAAGVDLSADGAFLYVASQDNGLVVLSVTNPTAPSLVGQLVPPPGSGAFRDVRLAPGGHIAYVVGGNGNGDPALHVIAVTNPVVPVLLAAYADPQRGERFSDLALSADGTTAFLVGNNVGLQIVDVSRKTAVHFLAELYEVIDDVSPQSTGIALSPDDAIAYVAQRGSGLRIVDVSGVRDIDDDGLPNWWELRYFNSVTAAAAGVDSDHDGQSNFLEYVADTVPTDSNAVFRIESFSVQGGIRVGLSGSVARAYTLIGRATVGAPVADIILITNGPDDAMLLVDTNAGTRRFYSVDVAIP